MTKQLGVGLYGAGNVVQEAHAPAVNAVAATRLAAVCDIDEARAKALADKYGGANVYADYARMLADPAVRSKLAALGQVIPPADKQTPEALSAHQKAEIDKWWPIVKAANIKID